MHLHRRHLRSANRYLLAVPRFPLNTYAVGRSQLLGRWSGTHSRILSGIQRAAQTVLGVYLKRTCSRVTSASSALGVLNDCALYKSTHSLTHSLIWHIKRVQILHYRKYLVIFSHWRIRFYSTLAFFCSLTNGVARRPCTFSLCLYWTGSHKTFTMQSVPAASKFSCFSLFFWRTASQGRQFSPKFGRVPFPPSPILISLPFFTFSHLPSPTSSKIQPGSPVSECL